MALRLPALPCSTSTPAARTRAFPAAPRPWEGTLDLSFDPGAGADREGDAIAVQCDGKIIIGGDFNSYRGTSRNSIARINADGTLDSTFDPGTGTGSPYQIYAMALQPDGKILIGGGFVSYAETERIGIARINANGTLDAAFDSTDQLQNVWAIVYSIVPLADGKVLADGNFSYDYGDGTERGGIARLNANGTLDMSFNPGEGTSGTVNSILCDGSGKILLGGIFQWLDQDARTGLGRLQASGPVDPSFDPGTGATELVDGSGESVKAIALQSDGKVLIGGTFTAYDGTARSRVARVDAYNVAYHVYLPITLR